MLNKNLKSNLNILLLHYPILFYNYHKLHNFEHTLSAK